MQSMTCLGLKAVDAGGEEAHDDVPQQPPCDRMGPHDAPIVDITITNARAAGVEYRLPASTLMARDPGIMKA